MCDFKENDEVVVTNFKYIYPDYNWLSVGMLGFIEKEIPTNNKRGAKRYLINFQLLGSSQIRSAKLYSDEIEKVCYNPLSNQFETVCKERNDIMEKCECENDIIKEFYETSLKNINGKYENKIFEVKKGDPVNSLFHTTKKELAEKLNIPINSLKIAVTVPLQGTIFLSTGNTPIEEFNDFCLIDGEPFSKDIKKAVSELSDNRVKEIEQLNDLCKKADTVIDYAENYTEIFDILNEYKIMNYHKINEIYGLEKNDSKKGE